MGGENIKKFILFSVILLIVSGCNDKKLDNKNKYNNISKETAKIMLNAEVTNNSDEENDINNSKKEEMEEVIKEESNKQEKPEINIDKEEEKSNILKDGEEKHEENDLVDIEDPGYQIHKGVIDCNNIDECMEKSSQIQLRYNNLISDVTYLEIMSNNHNVLGYYIDYKFREYNYDEKDECLKEENSIKNDFGDKIKSFYCSEDGILYLNKQDDGEVDD